MTCKLPMWNRERKYTIYKNEELTYYECKLLDNSDIHSETVNIPNNG